jgi:hypothetical protein
MPVTQVLGLVSAVGVLAAIWLVAWHVLFGRQLLATAPLVFLGLQSINALGLIVAVDHARGDLFEVSWPWLVLGGLAAFVAGGAVSSTAMRFRARTEIAVWRNSPILDDYRIPEIRWLAIAVGSLCLAVGAWFVQRVGYNTFQVALVDLVQQGAVDRVQVSQNRSDATRGSYNAVGFVIQFVAFALPALLALAYLHARLMRRTGLKLGLAGLAGLNVYFLTTVGGRQHLLFALLTVVFLLVDWTSPLPAGQRIRRGRATALVMIVLVLFGFTTVLQGRAEANVTSVASEAVHGFWNRLGGDYSTDQLRAIKHLEREAPVYGAHWANELSGAIPGVQRREVFDEQMHLVLYGHARGNFPLDPWGSYYYNWGAVGMLIVAFGLGAALQWFTVRLLICRPRRLSTVTLVSIAGYSGGQIIGPYGFLLSGMVTILLIHGVATMLWRRVQQRERVGRPAGAAMPGESLVALPRN